MNEGIHLDLDTWIVPGQIRKANLCRVVITNYLMSLAMNPPSLTITLRTALSTTGPPARNVHQEAETQTLIAIAMTIHGDSLGVQAGLMEVSF